MTATLRNTATIADLAHARARRQPDRTAFTALDGDATPAATLTAGELDLAARALGARLRTLALPGDRVLLPAMPGLGFHVAFLACLYARLVAVPTPPVRLSGRPGADRHTRLIAICRDCAPAAMVLPAARIDQLAVAWAGHPELAAVPLVSVEPHGDREPLPGPEPADAEELALLQYTSGSTAAPRGVLLSHRALLANQEMVRRHMGNGPDTTLVSWLPTYHDMGLCLGLLQPLFAGGAALVMAPETFVMRPERWLRAISGLPDVMSAAPDFGYAWCVRRIRERTKAGIDLSGWRVAINGAEPVRPETLRDFHAAFADLGLRERTLTPAYGLAEATLFVTGSTGDGAPVVRRYDRDALAAGRAERAAGDGSVELVGCGVPGADVEVAIVDPDTRRTLPGGRVGEIWVRSPATGTGYWGQPELSREIFDARRAGDPDADRGWLRTGDLGFLDEEELFVIGRRKDVIVIHGANYYPQDFERLTTQAHPLFRDESAAAYAVGDRVTVVVETSVRGDRDGATEAAAEAVRAITEELPVSTDVVVVPRGQIPRTTSGKPRRHECGPRHANGELTVLARWPRDPGSLS